MSEKKPVLLSGIQPTGNLTIGNYAGSIRNWVGLQDRYHCLVFLADLHAITVPQDPTTLLNRSYEFLALYLACGMDADRSTVFVQSHVPEHAELAWVLNCCAYMGELGRMARFKEKASAANGGASVGLFDYPVLMAADILVHDADLVPVGEDQKQHLELARDLAVRFNNRFGPTFTVPEPYIPPAGGRIRSLLDPAKKMSKTDPNPNSYVALLDDPDTIRRKIRRAVTDPGREIIHADSKPGISSLLEIFVCITGESSEVIEQRYRGRGYADFKADLTDILVGFLRPIQRDCGAILADKTGLERILSRNAEKARRRARAQLDRAHKALGFIPSRPS